MDPLTALGAAASVVQFVSFASDLISKTVEIYSSSEESSTRTANIETIYARLEQLSTDLETASHRTFPQSLTVASDTTLENHVSAINVLSKTCKKDCDRLLGVLRKIEKPAGRKTRWRSFCLALETVWKKEEIAELELSLHYTQTTLTLHLSSITSHWQSGFQHQLNQFLRENANLGAEHSTKLDGLEASIRNLSTFIAMTQSSRPLKPGDLDLLQNDVSWLAGACVGAEKQLTILKSLHFESRPARYASVSDSHRATFEWVFDTDTNRPEVGDLAGWLKREDGLFWVSGKPGSGKSTLMKFMTEDTRTQQALRRWSRLDMKPDDDNSKEKRVVIIKHFFWVAGTQMQRSWQGLLQTLLYDIFRNLPDLIETVCPERWLAVSDELHSEKWHIRELRDALYRVANLNMPGSKLCLFIDGLDEFEGDHLEACEALRRLAASPNIKICVSSRPWNVFEDSLGAGDYPKLYMHKLTEHDIQVYVRDKLAEHPRWKHLDIATEQTTWLIDEITRKAAGVFLWVVLVVRELRRGLTERDRYSDLRKRLESVPSDLTAFFTQILDSVDPFYHEKMANTLQIALTAMEPLDMSIYEFIDDEYYDPDYFLHTPPQPVLKREILEQDQATREKVERRMSTICRGLLELNPGTDCVEFMHRTVLDFFGTRCMAEYLERKVSPNLNTSLSLLKAYGALLRSRRTDGLVMRKSFANFSTDFNSRGRPISTHLVDALRYAKQLGPDPSAYRVLDCIHEAVASLPRNSWGNGLKAPSLFFWEPVIDARLTEYLHHVTQRLPTYFPIIKGPAESALICYLLLRLVEGVLQDKAIELLISCLKIVDYQHTSYSIPYSILPQHALDRMLSFVVTKVISSSLSQSHQPPPYNNYNGAARWNLEWVLDNGLIQLLIENNANSHIDLIEQNHFQPTPAWLEYVLLAFSIPTQSSYEKLFLETLQTILDAKVGPDVLAQRYFKEPSSPYLVSGYDLFLKHVRDSDQGLEFNHALVDEVSKRLRDYARRSGGDNTDHSVKYVRYRPVDPSNLDPW